MDGNSNSSEGVGMKRDLLAMGFEEAAVRSAVQRTTAMGE
jgi:hypothetical protein